MQGNYVWGVVARPGRQGHDMGGRPSSRHLSVDSATGTQAGLDELRGELTRQWQAVRALQQQKDDVISRQLAALRHARATERRVRELTLDAHAQRPGADRS
ncbi:MAG: hypothetical protein ACOYBY_11740 [Dermatophilaceae bacterium]